MPAQTAESDTFSSLELCDWITGLFSEKLHIDVPSAETDLMEAGAMDSLALVELLVHLEEELDIQIALDDVDLDSFRSISRIAEFVGRSQARRNGNGNGNGHQKRP